LVEGFGDEKLGKEEKKNFINMGLTASQRRRMLLPVERPVLLGGKKMDANSVQITPRDRMIRTELFAKSTRLFWGRGRTTIQPKRKNGEARNVRRNGKPPDHSGLGETQGGGFARGNILSKRTQRRAKLKMS